MQLYTLARTAAAAGVAHVPRGLGRWPGRGARVWAQVGALVWEPFECRVPPILLRDNSGEFKQECILQS